MSEDKLAMTDEMMHDLLYLVVGAAIGEIMFAVVSLILALLFPSKSR